MGLRYSGSFPAAPQARTVFGATPSISAACLTVSITSRFADFILGPLQRARPLRPSTAGATAPSGSDGHDGQPHQQPYQSCPRTAIRIATDSCRQYGVYQSRPIARLPNPTGALEEEAGNRPPPFASRPIGRGDSPAPHPAADRRGARGLGPSPAADAEDAGFGGQSRGRAPQQFGSSVPAAGDTVPSLAATGSQNGPTAH